MAAADRREKRRRTSQSPSSSAAGVRGITAEEVKDVEELSSPRAPVIYEIVRRMGEEEMERPAMSLWWSGLAAGLSISFSLLAQAILELHLPETAWRPLIAGFGYSVGFLMVVLGRQQLFTENTITAVLPFAVKPTLRQFARLSRMWAIVLAANLVGTLLAAVFCTFTPAVQPDVFKQMLTISAHLTELPWSSAFFGAISSGFLIAAMVWLIPSSEGGQFLVITLMTYLIAVGGFTHIIAGSVEALLLVVNGHWGLTAMLWSFTVPVLLGNIVGGTVLFAVLSYAQVMKEI